MIAQVLVEELILRNFIDGNLRVRNSKRCSWNGARDFWSGFWQMFVILSVMNLMDRFLVDDYWVGHTKAWTIPGTEDLRPYISSEDKRRKWIGGTVGMAVISAVLAGIAALVM